MLVPPLRIKLRSARYRRAALSLCYGGMAEPGRIERLTLRSPRYSRPLEEPTSAGSNWRKAAGADPQTFRFHSVSNGSPGPPGIAFHTWIWRSVIGIEPSAIAGRPVLQTPLRSQPRHAPFWRMTRESNSRPTGRIAFPARARSLPGMSSICGTPGPIRTDTAWLLRPVPPAVGLLGRSGAHGTI